MNITNDWIEQLYIKEKLDMQTRLNFMDAKQYQKVISETAIFPEEIGLAYCAMGLTGEAGEVSDKIKKLYRDKDFLNSKEISQTDKHAIAKELGDVLWYITALSKLTGYTLEEIMEMNYKKLKLRRSTNTLHGSGDNREEV